MLVDPDVLRTFAAQVEDASSAIAAADVGTKVATSADGLAGSTTRWAVRMVGQHIGRMAADIAKNVSEMGIAVRGAGDTYEVSDETLAGSFGVVHLDSSGTFVSRTSSWESSTLYGTMTKGTRNISVTWADNSNLTITETADGYRTAGITTANGRHGTLPAEHPLLHGTIPQVLGGAFTGLDSHVGRGGGIPVLTDDAIQKVGVGAKFAGPALGLAGAAYNVFAAETATQACVGGISGLFAVGGDVGGGAAGTWAAGVAGISTGPFAPVGVPLFAIGGALLGQTALGALGTKIGEAVCA